MSDNVNLKNKIDSVNENFENLTTEKLEEMRMKKLKEELTKSFESYKKVMKFLETDAPIEILGLSGGTVKKLLAHGCLRVYDLFDLDFTKVKGLGKIRISELTTCLDQFFSML